MLQAWEAALLTAFTSAVIVHGGLTLVEMVAPREVHPLASRLRGVKFWIVSILLASLIAMALQPLWRFLHLKPLLELHVAQRVDWAGPFAGLVISVLVILFTDFFGYWFHRLQHGLLWRFHAVHHSIEEVNAVNSYGHFADEFFRAFAMGVPMSLIAFGPYDAPIYLTIWATGQLVFLHSPTRLHFGPLGWFLADNRYHRIHHSLEPRHFNRNYGTMTTIWDRVFGTAYIPARDEWPKTGLAEMPEPRTVGEYVDLPLRYRRPEAVAQSQSS